MQHNKSLEEKTNEYWHLSSIWNGRLEPEQINTGYMLTHLSTMINSTSSKKRVVELAGKLLTDVIKPSKRRKNKKGVAPINMSEKRVVNNV